MARMSPTCEAGSVRRGVAGRSVKRESTVAPHVPEHRERLRRDQSPWRSAVEARIGGKPAAWRQRRRATTRRCRAIPRLRERSAGSDVPHPYAGGGRHSRSDDRAHPPVPRARAYHGSWPVPQAPLCAPGPNGAGASAVASAPRGARTLGGSRPQSGGQARRAPHGVITKSCNPHAGAPGHP